ncbi:MAG: hypothetical protein DRI61_16675 [Chloroflexi bacterium]|nr:MAG: hypothetical protein DRI61_16675 [Chloroflexota bacterium]
MLVDYHGGTLRMEDIAAFWHINKDRGYIPPSNLFRNLWEQAFMGWWYDAETPAFTCANITKYIDEGKPIFLGIDSIDHAVVIVGYTTVLTNGEPMQILYVHDPSGYLLSTALNVRDAYPGKGCPIAVPVTYQELEHLWTQGTSNIILASRKTTHPRNASIAVMSSITFCSYEVGSDGWPENLLTFTSIYDYGIRWEREDNEEKYRCPTLYTNGECYVSIDAIVGNSGSDELKCRLEVIIVDQKNNRLLSRVSHSGDEWATIRGYRCGKIGLFLQTLDLQSLPPSEKYFMEIRLLGQEGVVDSFGPFSFLVDVEEMRWSGVAHELKIDMVNSVNIPHAPISQVDLYVTRDIALVRITETQVDEVDIEARGQVYRYIELVSENMDIDVALSHANLYFEVPKEWIQQHGLTNNDIVLQKFNPWRNRWEILETHFLKEEDGICYFVAHSDSLSLFAISGVNAQERIPVLVEYGPNPVLPEGCIFWLNLPDDAVEATLKIFDVDGALLVSIPLDPAADRYPETGRWIPQDNQGRLLGTGLYLYLVEIVHADGTTTCSPVQKMVIQR